MCPAYIRLPLTGSTNAPPQAVSWSTLQWKNIAYKIGKLLTIPLRRQGRCQKKKRDYVGKIPKWRTPSPHPPSLGIFTFVYRFLKYFFAI